MSTNFIAAIWICFVLCTLVCLVTEGAYLNTDPSHMFDKGGTVLNMIDAPLYTSSTSAVDVSFPVMVSNFFTGIWKILVWDYSFWKLNPALQLVRIIFCYPITIAAIWGLLQLFSSAISSFFRIGA